jgi:hypothetical protein
MVTCNRLCAKREDRLRFTFELGISRFAQSRRGVAALASLEHAPRQSTVIPGLAKREPRRAPCAPENLEIPGSMLRIAPE